MPRNIIGIYEARQVYKKGDEYFRTYGYRNMSKERYISQFGLMFMIDDKVSEDSDGLTGLSAMVNRLESSGLKRKVAYDFIVFSILKGHIELGSKGSYEGKYSDDDTVKYIDALISGFEFENPTKKTFPEYADEIKILIESEIISFGDVPDFIQKYLLAFIMLNEKQNFLNHEDEFLFFRMSTKGYNYYLLNSTEIYLERLRSTKNDIETMEGSLSALSKKNKRMFRHMKTFESNIMMYMTIFIAIMALIGINYSYTAGMIENHSIIGIVLINGSLAITLTLIFLLVDFSKTYALLIDAEEKNGWWSIFTKKCGGYLFILLLELIVIALFLGAYEFIYLR